MESTTTATEHDVTSQDVGARQVAAVYAKGLLAATEKTDSTATVVEQLDVLVKEVLARHPKLQEIWASALIKHDDKVAMIQRILGGKVSPTVIAFLGVLSSHGRLGILSSVHKEIHRQLDDLRGHVRVFVSTAASLSGQEVENITKALRPLVHGEPQVVQNVDPTLIGGMVLRVGDTLLDGSVARQLAQVREKMIARSVYEIQSRRDRFRHSDGN
jgi:F-type H+-transporting ATPase subunit delta